MSLRQRQPAALDLRSVLAAALTARDEVPDLFALWLDDAYTDDGWHTPAAADEPFAHHASSLAGCGRRHVLERSGTEIEPTSVNSLITFEVGRHMHLLIQFGLAVCSEYELLAHEVGGSVQLPDGAVLSAHADAVYLHDGVRYLVEVKTEATYSARMRRIEAARAGRTSSARPEHVEQVGAQALVLAALHPELTPDAAFVCYWEKNGGVIDQQPVLLDDELWERVLRRVRSRERMWRSWTNYEGLPPRLDSWPGGLCQPRSDTDVRGKYCPVRVACLRRPA
jgi:hypothetical protein